MTIEWLDATFGSTRLTRGWIWKKQAIVISHACTFDWKYQSGRKVPDWLDDELRRARTKAFVAVEQALLESDWAPAGRLPPARVVMKGTR